MSDWLTFQGRVEPVVWGRATYTILILPPDIAEALAARGARRVEGEINDQPVNLALSRAPVVEGVFLWTGKSLLDRLNIEPGEPLDIRLRPALSDEVEAPDDLVSALRAAGQAEPWAHLTPGKQRGMLYKLGLAKTAVTRAKRIAEIVSQLADNIPDTATRPRSRSGSRS